MSNKKISSRKIIILIVDALLMALIITADWFSQIFVIDNIKGKGSYIIFENVLQLVYRENYGTVFGMLNSQKLFLIFIGFVISALVFTVLIRLPDKRKFTVANIMLSFILAGAGGNLIERFRYGFVIDFIYFIGIDFPVFNVADIFIFIGCITILFLLIFYYKENDLVFLNLKKAYFRELK